MSKFYYCKKCNRIHYENTKKYSEHNIHRKHNSEFILSKYFCLKCRNIHKKKSNIFIKHYEFKSSDNELNSDEIWILQFRKSWYREAKKQREVKK